MTQWMSGSRLKRCSHTCCKRELYRLRTAILLLCTWPLLQFYSVRTRHEMDDILDVKNACKSLQSVIHLWMYVINFSPRRIRSAIAMYKVTIPAALYTHPLFHYRLKWQLRCGIHRYLISLIATYISYNLWHYWMLACIRLTPWCC